MLSPNRIGNLRLCLSSRCASGGREQTGKKDLAPIGTDLVFHLKRTFLDLLFPPRCAGCRKVGGWLCSECRNTIKLLKPPLCPHCGLPTAQGKLCLRCQRASLQIDGVRSVAFFEDPMREAIHRLKYFNSQDLAAPLGEMMVSYWQDIHLPADVIVPVPLHARRLRERGPCWPAKILLRLTIMRPSIFFIQTRKYRFTIRITKRNRCIMSCINVRKKVTVCSMRKRLL